MISSSEKTHTPEVLLVGGLNNDSITTHIKSIGGMYVQKMLASSVKNWESINNLLTSANVKSVLVKLTESDFHLAFRTEYQDPFFRMCELLLKRPHGVFVYNDLLSNEPPVFDEAFTALWNEVRDLDRHPNDVDFAAYSVAQGCRVYERERADYQNEFQQFWEKVMALGLRIIPYRSLVELNVAAQQVLDESFVDYYSEFMYRTSVCGPAKWTSC